MRPGKSPIQVMHGGSRLPFQLPSEAATYAVARALDAANMALWESAIRQAVNERSIALAIDVGCGTGHFLAAISDATDACVFGIDLSLPMLAEARILSGGALPLLCANGMRLPVVSESAGLLFYSMVIHHFDNLAEAFQEARRCLRRNGLMCIRTSTVDHLEQFAYLRYFPAAMERDRLKLPSVQALVQLLESSSFFVERHDVIVQRAEANVADYVEFVRSRSLSDLMEISDEEFASGLERLVCDAERGCAIDLTEPMDFIVARRA